jgi:hypothetical protein
MIGWLIATLGDVYGPLIGGLMLDGSMKDLNMTILDEAERNDLLAFTAYIIQVFRKQASDSAR